MKLYIFLDNDENVITQVRSENHDGAIAQTGLDWNTPFYSESISKEEESRSLVALNSLMA